MKIMTVAISLMVSACGQSNPEVPNIKIADRGDRSSESVFIIKVTGCDIYKIKSCVHNEGCESIYFTNCSAASIAK